jgi:RNA polymerase sigma-70 factor (ECF subfamily)
VSVTDAPETVAAEEAALVAQIAVGRRSGEVGAAVGELAKRYNKRLYAFGFRVLGDAGLADEMVQEIWVRLWQRAGRYDAEKASVGTYLFVIARSAAADIRKRPSSRPLQPVDDVDLPPQSDKVDQIIDSITIRDAMDSLGAGHAEVLRLAYEEDLTQSQIAERLKIPLGTVKTRMFNGMRAMRAALVERGFNAV